MRGDYNYLNSTRRYPAAYLGDSSIEEYSKPISSLPILPGPVNVVLQVLGPLLDKLFGWGDPNSQHDLSTMIVQGREQLAVSRDQAGQHDVFQFPSDYDPSDDKDVANLSMIIVNEYLQKYPMDLSHALTVDFEENKSTVDSGTFGTANLIEELWKTYPSSEERADKYSTIAHLKSDIQNVAYANTNAFLQSQGVSPVTNTTPVPSSPGYSQPAPDGQTPTPAAPNTMTPILIAGGIGLLLLVLMAAGD